MGARTLWKAELQLGDWSVPVRLYAAVQDRRVHFRLLHAEDLAPVRQQMVDPTRDEPVDSEDIRPGVEVEKRRYVLLDDEELEALTPTPSRAIQVTQAVPRAAVDLRWYDRPYYLGPDGQPERYFALVDALADSHHPVAIAHWVMRKRHYQGALQSRDGYLVLETLRHANELVRLDALEVDPAHEPDERERKLAAQLIAALEDDFRPEDYRDTHRERVMGLIEDKAAGRTPEAKAKPAARRKPRSLAEDLEASLKQSKEIARAG